VVQTRYRPYGQERWTEGGAVSDYTFTGQRVERGFGLMDYNARYYDPRLGRFISADALVPSYANPQALNRYTYVLNRPLNLFDPTGQRYECGSYAGECSSDTYYAGFSVLDDRPEVQAYQEWAMDPKHFLEPIVDWALFGMAGGLIGDIVNIGIDLLIPGLRAPVMRYPAGQHRDIIGDPGPTGRNRYPAAQATGSTSSVTQSGNFVDTPYGPAVQDSSPSAQGLREEVASGRMIYRAGAFGQSNAAEGQFWGVDSPLEPGYADKYGIASYTEPGFVIGGTVKSGANFVTRPAPGYGTNAGGALEVVVEPGGVKIEFFHMP
jgi:RHS repeat-associated protein